METTEAPAPLLLDPAGTLVFVDVENFGLDEVNDPPLEIGFTITDLKLNVLHQQSWLIWEPWWYGDRMQELRERRDTGEDSAAIVYNMHLGSGLWEEAEADGNTIVWTQEDILAWFEEIGLPKRLELCGSSVKFDFNIINFHMPRLIEYFHHRVVDISSFKVVAEKYFPSVAKGAKELNPTKRHRVLFDLEDTINEFRYYANHMLDINLIPESV